MKSRPLNSSHWITLEKDWRFSTPASATSTLWFFRCSSLITTSSEFVQQKTNCSWMVKAVISLCNEETVATDSSSVRSQTLSSPSLAALTTKELWPPSPSSSRAMTPRPVIAFV